MPDPIVITYALGIDVGVTNTKFVRATPAGEILSKHSFETHAESPDWPRRVLARVGEIEGEFGPAAHTGVASPGVAMPDYSRIRWMRGRLAEVQGLRWSDLLRRPAPVLNDAHAALLGEHWLGAARGVDNVFLLTLGTGVGGAAMVGGRLLRGHLGRAGHLGHVCLDLAGDKDIVNTPGSLEQMIGNYTIARRTAGRFHSTLDLLRAVRAGDSAAAAVWDASVHALACAVASLVNVLDPRRVIIGGGIASAAELLFNPLRDKLREFAWSLEGEEVEVIPAQLGEYAGAIGAAYQALQSQHPPHQT